MRHETDRYLVESRVYCRQSTVKGYAAFRLRLQMPVVDTSISTKPPDQCPKTGTVARQGRRERLRSKMQVRVVAMDFTHVAEQGHDKAVMHASDANTGLVIEITPLHAEDERTVTRYVQRIARLTGCEVIVTDDADMFKAAADAAGVQHALCQQHVVPNTLTLLSEIAEQIEHLPSHQPIPPGVSVAQAFDDIALLEETILARSPGSQRHLDELCRRYQSAPVPKRHVKATPWYRLRLLTLDLAEDWPRLTMSERYRTGDGQRLVPATNNVSERGIGLNIKERYRTMRGYKSTTSLRCTPALTAYLREQQGAECFSDLLAA